jgi:hypothetical protein
MGSSMLTQHLVFNKKKKKLQLDFSFLFLLKKKKKTTYHISIEEKKIYNKISSSIFPSLQPLLHYLETWSISLHWMFFK